MNGTVNEAGGIRHGFGGPAEHLAGQVGGQGGAVRGRRADRPAGAAGPPVCNPRGHPRSNFTSRARPSAAAVPGVARRLGGADDQEDE
jgi:hypothetical protein